MILAGLYLVTIGTYTWIIYYLMSSFVRTVERQREAYLRMLEIKDKLFLETLGKVTDTIITTKYVETVKREYHE